MPGAGAEILNDRVRRLVSKGKCGAQEWLDIMRVAHQLDLTTSATMMFGHVEKLMERMEHLVSIRQVQSEKPDLAKGFLAFIPWPFQDEGTMLRKLIFAHDHLEFQLLPQVKSLNQLLSKIARPRDVSFSLIL